MTALDKKPIEHSRLDRTFCVAPMLDCTDRHARFLMRQISSHAVMYTEMVTTGALIHGDRHRFLDFDVQEHPVALQLGGSDLSDMAKCAVIAQEWGYDEVNINVGCPSDRVQSGSFGACLMQQPELVAENVKAMNSVVDIPVTVKSRIGVDDQNPKQALWKLTELVAEAGCRVLVVHARKAWLKGLSPKENRDIPSLDYDLVYELKNAFPEMEIIINGGIKTLAECQLHLAYVDGVMMGREAYSNPFILSQVDKTLYQQIESKPSREQVLEKYIEYAKKQLETGTRLNHISRHVVGLFHGQPNSRLWRQHISEHAHLPDAGIEVLTDAMQKLQRANQYHDHYHRKQSSVQA